MGGHSDSEGRRSHSKKKRSQSRSPKRHKKYFRRHSRSSSRSPVRRRSRSLSNNRKKYHSKSKSPARYRSKSKSPHRLHSRSKSPTRRRSRSKSPIRRRSRSKSSSRRRSRTKSPVKHHSRSKSPNKSSKSKEKQMKHGSLQSREKTGNRKKEHKVNKDPDINLTGFEDLLPVEQAKIRMKLALSAAVSSEIPSKDQKNEDKVVHKKSLLEQMDRTKAIEAINNPEFVQQSFKSKQEDKEFEKKDLHSEAMFGEAKVEPLEVKINPQKLTQTYSDCLAHPNLFEDVAEKEERWRKKLSAMRQSKLNEGKLF